MAGKILVTYGSWCGSTAEVAQEIGKVLATSGAQVDVVPADKAGDLSQYGGVVLGTAIRAGRPKGEVTKFAGKHRDALRRMPVALFGVCGQMSEPTDDNRTKAEAFVAGLSGTLQPASVAVFGGAVLPERLRFPMSIFAKSVPAGDWRDWDAIRSWAESLRPLLAGS
ncbi:MAG: flavodoxin domain-containing protein [Anaerolineae bacterium]